MHIAISKLSVDRQELSDEKSKKKNVGRFSVRRMRLIARARTSERVLRGNCRRDWVPDQINKHDKR